ncbi:TIGR00180 family glycosyltransferase [Candidatus Pelagibacter sp.]|uniref:TIGR00180 family glycosyltransferase n=1 Tax=Candidatus Pelagibacter sp. TaxID=2024849 RepID=UPI003F848E2B
MSKTTIVIPLIDRHEFTERVLSYYNTNKVNHLFYIADGSKEKRFNQKYLEKKFPNVRFKYRSFPFDKNFKLFTKKMFEVAKAIKTQYVYQIANDDFFNPNFIKKSELFLSKNKSYNFVGGKVLNFKIIQPFKKVNDFGFFKMDKKVQYWRYKNAYKSINSNSRIKRVENFLMSLTYECLIKKSTYLEIWKYAYKFKIANSFELNWFMNIIPLINGKKHFINMTSVLRQSNTHEGLGLSEMLKTGAKKKRYINFLIFLQKQKILTSKLLLAKLKKVENSSIDIIDPTTSEGKKHIFKTKWFPIYYSINNIIKNTNYYLLYLFFFNKKNKYASLIKKIKIYLND